MGTGWERAGGFSPAENGRLGAYLDARNFDLCRNRIDPAANVQRHYLLNCAWIKVRPNGTVETVTRVPGCRPEERLP